MVTREEILEFMDRAGTFTIPQIARGLGEKVSAVAGPLFIMARDGLVRPLDPRGTTPREVELELTPKGRKLARE